ncbi:MAG: polyribonucleotide nucleotidyltransferase [Elusimicrobiota bacterium]
MSNQIQKISLSENIGGKEITIQTGTLAKQAGGAVTIHLGGTALLTTATASKNIRDVPFLPMSVEYRERTYAAGKIPGGFFKRETRPRDKEVLNARMTDRPIRPMLPENWRYDTMIYSLLISMDGENDAGPLSITGGSVSCLLSDIPLPEAVSGLRIGRDKETQQFIFFPTFAERENLDLEMIVAGKKDAILMVEGGAAGLSEEVMVEALELAQKEINKLCALQERIVEESVKAGRKIVKKQAPVIEVVEPVTSFVKEQATDEIKKHLRAGYKGKHDLDDRIKEIQERLIEEVKKKAESDPAFAGQESHVGTVLYHLKGDEARRMIIEEKVRPDGRKCDEVRPIDIQMPVLPCAHGSAVFTRGETQALVSATLGTPGDMQVMDELEGDYKERFMLHYNFPGYSVGEVKPERGPGRRDIGHGTLARRALVSLLPPPEEFPYTVRIVSDILESNGSSSMASVCGGSLAMFDAGVPLKAACAGVAMGLFMEDGKYAVLTDIAGLEDHIGDMDFKVAGTRDGITTIQMDIKIGGLTIDIMKEAMAQAKAGRFHILDKMDAVLAAPRSELAANAPRLLRLHIPPAKIGALIGPGGKNIRRLSEEYDVSVDVEDDGSVFVAGLDADSVKQAQAEIEGMTAEPELNKIYKGRVVSCVEFGAFVEIMPGREGLLHISQIDVKRVEKVTDVLKEGDEVEVKVLEVSPEGKVRLSRKAVLSPGSELDSPGPNRGAGGGRRDSRGGSGGGGRGGDRGPRRGGPPRRERSGGPRR